MAILRQRTVKIEQGLHERLADAVAFRISHRGEAGVLNQPYFQDEEVAYAKLESFVWPDGAVCPHCGCTDRMKRTGGIATRPGLYKCYACRKQSRVTVGTVFESSHIKLHVWL